MAVRVWLAGVNRTSDVLLEGIVITKREAQRHTAEFIVQVPAAGGAIPTQGQRVRIEEDPDNLVVFGGIVQTVDRQAIRDQKTGIWQLRARCFCSDFKLLTDRRLAGSRSWVNEFATNIARTILSESLELSDGVIIDDITPNQGPEIKSFSIDYPSVSKALDQLLALCPPNWRWEIGYDQRAQFGPVDTDAIQWTIGADNYDVAINGLTVSYDSTSRANKIVAIFERYETDEQTETFAPGHATQAPNGTRREWEMVYRLARVPTVTMNGATETVGIRDVDVSAQWWWSQDSNIVSRNPAISPPGAGTTLVVVYVGYERIEEFVQDNADIAAVATAEGTSGVYEELITFSGSVPRGDALQIAEAALAAKKVPGATLRATSSNQVDNWRPEPSDTMRVTGRAGLPDQVFIVRAVTLTILPLRDPADRRFSRRIEAQTGATVLDGLSFFSASSGTASGAAAATISGGFVVGGGAATWAKQTITGASGTVTLDHASYTHFDVTCSAHVTLAAPTGLRDGLPLFVRIAHGGNEITFAPGWPTGMRDIIHEAGTARLIRCSVFGGAIMLEGTDDEG